MGVDTLASTLGLVSLRTGATIASAPATTPERAAESFSTATKLVVSADGTLAWIGRRSAIGALTPVYEVHSLSGARGDRLLQSSTLEPRSLTIRGNTLTWSTGSHRSSTIV
jgi:hypothetical protein